ncbi:hypothetical protein [Vibrio splendidus]|uniref:hypothetical protein n=1 Tax=Vibrio splendidus TaxID=29497 RepID=UPI0022367746|nr:hypothetical protein [Vibrio splendidus]MCW4439924.1 hypothetical protein [Vibrio splendidus]
MKLFDFLEQMTKEKFPFQVNYIEWSSCIDVEVNAFSERWIVSFDEDGFVDFSILQAIDVSDNENAERLKSLFSRPQQAWLDASKDLGIEFISPFKFLGTDDREYEVTGLLPQFGCQNGTLVTSRKDDDESVFESEKLVGYYSSGLNPASYDQYNRGRFIETLKDWGWISGDPEPEWLGE